MITINRSAIVVHPKQPFLDWLCSVDPTSCELTVEILRDGASIYLIPHCENEEEAREFPGLKCGEIFEEQLDAWWREPSSWPACRDLEVFDAWFDWSLHSMIIDLSGARLRRERL
jgi:hypothetical protein